MVEAPKCKLCGAKHWLNDPHVVGKVGSGGRGQMRRDHGFSNVSRETITDPVRYDWDARERELGLRP